MKEFNFVNKQFTMAVASRDVKISKLFKERLDQLSCPYTENVDDAWIMELIFTPGEPRILLLQWLFSKLDPKLQDLLDPQYAPANTKMDSRIQRLLFVSSNLGFCSPDDADLVRGVTTGSRQLAFMNSLIDIVCTIDQYDSINSWSLGKSMSIHASLGDQFAADCSFMDELTSQYQIDKLYTSEVRLLPPDIVKQIEIDKSADKPIDSERQLLSSDITQLIEEANKLEKEVQRQSEIIEALKKMSKGNSTQESNLKVTTKQTIRLVSSELNQLITNFLCCYDNEMRHWCNKTPPQLNDLGIGFKRVHTLLLQFLTFLGAVQSVRSSHQKICVDQRQDISRIRQEISRINLNQKGQNHSGLLQHLKESVDELDQSIVRIDAQSRNVSANLSNISSGLVRLE